jgi:hypothetical protein
MTSSAWTAAAPGEILCPNAVTVTRGMRTSRSTRRCYRFHRATAMAGLMCFGATPISIRLLIIVLNSPMYPCPPGGTQTSPLPCNVHSRYALMGYRPIVQTLPGERVDPDPEVMVIQFRPDGSRALLRSSHIASISSPNDWLDASKAEQVGPLLPSNVDVVQATGGHESPTFYVGDPSSSMGLWRWSTGLAGWTQIVPGGALGSKAMIARRFFADPYNSSVVYVVDADGIKRSDDFGAHWMLDAGLTAAATEGGTFSLSGDGSVLKDLIFDASRPSLRVAICNSGVFFARDGQRWERLLSTTALNGHLVSGYLDSVSSTGPTVYVAMAGRGVLSLRIPSSPSNATS